MKLVTSLQMRNMDRLTIDKVGVPSTVLMDRAANGAVQAFLDHFCLPLGSTIGFFCGTGNNGGDGLAMAIALYERQFSPQILILGTPDSLSSDATTFLSIAQQLLPEDSFRFAPDCQSLQAHLADFPSSKVFCDALLGTGLDRTVQGRFARAIEFLNEQSAPVFAIDIPSGISADTGQVLGLAARAEVTASFGLRKIGQCLDPARTLCGVINDIDIQIPHSVQENVGHEAIGLDEEWLRGRVQPRPRDFHKGQAGRTLHIGGRAPTRGAIAMSACAALKAGAGLIHVGTEPSTASLLPPEIMCADLFSDSLHNALLEDLLKRCDRVVIGPGLGLDAIARDALLATLRHYSGTLILDADALTLISTEPSIKDALQIAENRQGNLVLTPHPGELSHLLSIGIDEILANPVDAARRTATLYRTVVVLKTAATVIASPDGKLAINLTGNPGMATGGMGDALTGLIAGLRGDFTTLFEGICAAVTLHGLAGDRGALTHGHRGLTVSSLLDELGPLWRSLES